MSHLSPNSSGQTPNIVSWPECQSFGGRVSHMGPAVIFLASYLFNPMQSYYLLTAYLFDLVEPVGNSGICVGEWCCCSSIVLF